MKGNRKIMTKEQIDKWSAIEGKKILEKLIITKPVKYTISFTTDDDGQKWVELYEYGTTNIAYEPFTVDNVDSKFIAVNKAWYKLNKMEYPTPTE